MRTLTITTLLTAGVLAAPVHAAPAGQTEADESEPVERDVREPARGASLEPVSSIPALSRLHSWDVVDDDTLILWASPFKPYLVELFRPSPELKFAWNIGVTSFGSRIHARFDTVEIDGFSYPIQEIYELSRDDAESLSGRS